MSLHAVRQLEAPEATAAFAASLAHVLRGGDVVALAGDLGAGKTTLVRELARAMGASEEFVHSPTFVMVNQYPVRPQGTNSTTPERLVHIDAYRLHGTDELDTLGWDTFMHMDATDPAGRPLSARDGVVVVIEWAERIEAALPAAARLARVKLVPTGEDSREVALELPDSWAERPGVRELLERDPTKCRVTGKWVSPTSPTFPFADERARMADLGKWFGEGFAVSRDLEADDMDE